MKYDISITPRELQKKGIKVLAKELTPVGMVKFLRQYENGTGDYTKERNAYLDDLTMDDLDKMINS